MDISDFPARYNDGHDPWQNHIEPILAGRVGEPSVPTYFGRDVTDIAQDDAGVDVELSDGQSLRARTVIVTGLYRRGGMRSLPRLHGVRDRPGCHDRNRTVDRGAVGRGLA